MQRIACSMPIDTELMPVELREEQLQEQPKASSPAKAEGTAAVEPTTAGNGEQQQPQTPGNIIVFYNSKSGGQMGKVVNDAMKQHLSADR